MLESLFGSRSIEQVLFFLLTNKSGYPSEIRRRCGGALTPYQKALDRLEQGGIVVSSLVGRTRVYVFNPRYPFLEELVSFLAKAYSFLPEEIRESIYEPKLRKRPRKRGKPL